MAKIMVEFDTIEKTMSASIDGVALENVVDISMGRSYDDEDEFCCSLTSMVEMKESGMRQMTRIVASESVEGKPLKKDGKKDVKFNNFIITDSKSIAADSKTKAYLDIQKFFIGE